MRQAVFSCLGGRVEGARFLDLFAGSGAYGLEAFSRGATGGTFVERSHKAIACLRQNIDAVARSVGRASASLTVLTTDATAFPLTESPPDLVFIDPPYELIPQIAAGLFERLTLLLAPAPDAIVCFEAPGELELEPAGWTCRKRLGKGARQPTVLFLQRSGTGAG